MDDTAIGPRGLGSAALAAGLSIVTTGTSSAVRPDVLRLLQLLSTDAVRWWPGAAGGGAGPTQHGALHRAGGDLSSWLQFLSEIY